MNSPLAESFSCQEYKELESIEEAFDLFKTTEQLSEWCFQFKYDGIWGKVVIDNKRLEVFSKTGQLKHSYAHGKYLPNLHGRQTILLGEFMYGSQWSKKAGREGLLYIFDCVVENGKDISTLPYKARLNIAKAFCADFDEICQPVQSYGVSQLGAIWQHIEKEKTWEGIIVRKWTSTYFTTLHKLKIEVEDDFVIMAIKPGNGKHEGRMGAITVGKYKDSQLLAIMDVGGGFTDAQREDATNHGKDWIGQVALIRGKGRFDSGALRHPTFIRIRDDKFALACIL